MFPARSLPTVPSSASRHAPRAAWRALACIALFGIAAVAQAATRDFYFRRVASDRGLAQNSVTALAQDPQGFVWVGTQGGLHRYDGQRYRLFRHDPGNPASLPDSFITALAVEGRDALWVGTYSEYLARIDLGSGAIRRYPAPATGAGQAQRVMAVLASRGAVWVGTAGGLARLDPKTGRTAPILRLDPAQSLAVPVQALQADRDGAIWYATAAGLYRIGPRGGVERIGPAMPTRSRKR